LTEGEVKKETIPAMSRTTPARINTGGIQEGKLFLLNEEAP
jgi:hypothetical protein